MEDHPAALGTTTAPDNRDVTSQMPDRAHSPLFPRGEARYADTPNGDLCSHGDRNDTTRPRDTADSRQSPHLRQVHWDDRSPRPPPLDSTHLKTQLYRQSLDPNSIK